MKLLRYHLCAVVLVGWCVSTQARTVYPFKKNNRLADTSFTYTSYSEEGKSVTHGELKALGITVDATWEKVEVARGTVELFITKPIKVFDIDFVSSAALYAFGIEEVQLALSSGICPYRDEGLWYVAGANLTGLIALNGSLEPLAYLAGVPVGTKMPFVMSVPINPLNATITFALPGYHRVNKMFAYDGIIVSTSLAGEVSVWVTTYIRPDEKSPELAFTTLGSVGVLPPSVDLSSSAEISWHNVFGIKGLTLEQVGCGVGLIVAPVVSLSRLALAGRLIIGTSSAEMAASVSVTDFKTGLYGKVKELHISDMMLFAAKLLGREIPKNKMPEFAVYENEILVAPEMFMIGGLFFEQGFFIKNSMMLFGKKVFNKFKLGYTGLIAEGYIEPFDIGIVQVRGDSPLGGPELKIAINIAPRFAISGEVIIGSFIRGKTSIYCLPNKVSFELDHRIMFDDKAFGYTAKCTGAFNVTDQPLQMEMTFDASLAIYLRSLVVKKMKLSGKTFLPFEIVRMSFSGNTDDVARGIVPRLVVRYRIGKEYKEVTIVLDLAKPARALRDVAEEMFDQLVSVKTVENGFRR